MANPSILAAFERMWQHTIAKIGTKADVSHEHSANDITSGVLPMSQGGTEATDGATGLANLFAAGDTVLSSYQYGAELPENAVTGQMFFQEATGTIADIGQDVAAAVRARNLLDNSYFVKPINQRGGTSYNASGYTIDRWKYTNSNGVLTINDGYINLSAASANSHWRQILEKALDATKSYTFAIRVRGTGTGFIGFYNSADTSSSIGGGYLNFTATSDWTTVLCTISNTANADMLTIRCDAGASLDIEWAALYEGEYTAETLPPYVPKGYSAELTECMRYFQKSAKIYRTVASNGIVQGTQFMIQMRIAPTVTIYDSDGIKGKVSCWAPDGISKVAVANIPAFMGGIYYVDAPAVPNSACCYSYEASADL